MELILGLVLLSSIGLGETMQTPPTNRVNETLCVDLGILYTQGASVQEFVQLYYEEWDIAWENTPFVKGNGITCHAERVENGILKPIFIRIR